MESGSHLLLEIIGAAGLLLWGIRMARTSVMRAHGPRIRQWLPKRLKNRLVAFLSGVLAAAVLQSSTAVGVFIASLASLGVVPLPGGLAVMLGADVGSALIAALLSLNLKGFWPALIIAGYLLHAAHSEGGAKGRQHGRFLLGLGMVLAALTFMGQASGELANSGTIRFLVASLSGEPVLAVLVMALLTWVASSSTATLLLLSSLAGSAVVSDPGFIVPAVLGVNLGGGLPALVMTWRQTPPARRIVAGNALFRLCGVVAGLLFTGAGEAAYAALPGTPGLRVVGLHVVFNLLLAAAFLCPLGRVARLLENLFAAPGSSSPESDPFGPRYIPAGPGGPGAAASPLPLSALTRETLRMGDVLMTMLSQTRELLPLDDDVRERIARIRRLDDRVDTLHKAISGYAIALVREALSREDMSRVTALLRYSASLENAGDIVDKSLLNIAGQKAKAKRLFSEEGNAELDRLFAFALETLQMSAEAVMGWKFETAELLLERKNECKNMVNASSEKHIERLRRGVSGSIETSSFHLSVINDLQRIHTLIVSIAADIASSREPVETDM